MFSFLIRWLSFAAGENRLEFRIMIQPIKAHVYLSRPRESELLWRPNTGHIVISRVLKVKPWSSWRLSGSA